jgi:micrococcal nuclease
MRNIKKNIINWLSMLLCAVMIAGISIDRAFAENNMDILFHRSSRYKKVLVRSIEKADTLILENGEKIKLIGLKAPEPPEDMDEKFTRTEHGFLIEKKVDDPGIPVAERSYTFAKDLLVNRYVRLEFDVEKNDKNFHTLAYVFLSEDGTFVNAEILKAGYAQLSIRPPNMKYASELRSAYQEARKNFRGLQGE